jgi:Histidine kinase-, DNA gyrase B-, and HSP90-like ATPase
MAIINNNNKKGTIRNQSIAAGTTTIALAATVYPHQVGRDLIPELAMRVYSSQLDSFREAISNAFDENSKKIVISISENKIAIEDWGNGIRDYNEFRKFGQASKKSRKDEEVIGEKGLGKLSLLNLGNCVCFETNNGNVGMKFYMTLEGFSSPIYKKPTAFVSHVGTRITITNLINTLQIEELIKYLKKAFGLRLAQGATIIIDGQSIKPRPNLEPAEKLLFRLSKVRSADANVTGNLKATEDGRGIVDFYIDHVFVTTLEVDTRRKFEGWVNCNALTPETSRNNIVQNEIYREFIGLLRQYTSRFPLRDISVDEHKLTLSRELNALLKSYLKDMMIAVQPQPLDTDVYRNNADKSPSSQRYGNNNTIHGTMEKTIPSIAEKTVAEEEDGSTKTPAKKQQQHRQNPSSNAAVRWEFADLGNEKEPIYFVPPNVIYCNTSNDLYQFAMNKNRRYGPIWIRMLPYLARIAVAMSSESSSRLTVDQLNTRVDEATRYFLRQKKVM